MKRIGLILTALLLALLCACAEQAERPTVYDVEYEGRTYTVDLTEQTISYDGVVCSFEITGESHSVFLVTYPDGSTYWQEEAGNKLESGWSDDYDAHRYVSGDTLWTVLGRSGGQEEESGGHFLIGVVLLIGGIYYTLPPRKGWLESRGWEERDEQSVKMLLMTRRVIGAACAVAGVVLFFV